MNELKAAIASAIKSVSKDWKQAKRSADRNDRVPYARLARMRCSSSRVTIKEVAFRVMEDAYNKASSNGRYYANARQIMYAARPAILEECDASEFKDVYFTQTLLKDYLEKYNPGWKVVWDARGHLIEPYTRRKVSLGGAGVKEYTGEWNSEIDDGVPEIESRIDTHGPGNRYANALFIEKEGFTEILMDAKIGQRFDMAIMSTKGIPVDAACDLITAMDRQGLRVFVLHDFDLSGFKILRTLRTGTRLSSGTNVIDLGLRLNDVKDLPSEPVEYSQGINPRYYLRKCGATKEEMDFLVEDGNRRWMGQRVEINAMTSEQLITWLEMKFAEHGVKKVVPTKEVLTAAYKRAVFSQRLGAEIKRLKEVVGKVETTDLDDINAKVVEMIEEDPELSWDDAIWKLAGENTDDDDEVSDDGTH
jgi:hypothetical protein